MKLHQLAALVSASESGSLRQAAEKLHLSQPALSRSIRELENELGVKLLERTPLGVEPTAYGKAVILRSRIVDSELRQAKDDIAHLRAATRGDLRIGATPVAAFSLLPAVLARLKKSRPQLQVSVTDGMGSSLFQQLRQGDFDFVFGRIDQDIDPHEFSADVLFNDSLVVVARRDHPLARTRPGQKMKWEETEWFLPSGDNPARTAFEKAFYARSGKAPRSTIDSNSFVTMLTIISQTDLLGIAPHQIFSVAWLQQAFMVLDLGLKFPVQPTGVIRRARSAPSAVAQYAINELRHAARQVAKPKPANAAPAASAPPW
ncbi:MAG TPA: LysR substrate-binding domain-containing protein [Pseudolabrys sp.]|nr:LysR substrate-binding domain-containing protein [Pseudolabrys sp.]